MSTLPNPPFDGSRAERPLSLDEQAVLDDIAGHENAGDPGFVTRLREHREPVAVAGIPPERVETRREVLARARRRDLAIQTVIVVGLAALLLPAPWFVGAVVTVALLGIPLALVAGAWREAGRARPQREPRR